MGKHARHSLKAQELREKRANRPVNEELRQEKILPIIASLKSVSTVERAEALNTILQIINEESARQMLLRERLIKLILTNVLSDNSLELVAQGLDVLRGVIMAEGRDPAKFVVREKLRIPLSNFTERILVSLETGASLDMNQRQIMDHMARSVCGLVSAIVLFLGEMSGVTDVYKLGIRIAATIGESDFLFAGETVETAYELLYYSSEDFPQVIYDILGEQGVLDLHTRGIEAPGSTWITKIYAIGVAFNVLDLTSESFEVINVPQLLIAYLQEVPKDEVKSVQTCLELVALLAQSDDPDLVSMLFSKVYPLIHGELFRNQDYQLHCVNVLNNLGWSLNALDQDWESAAKIIYDDTLQSCFAQLDDIELVSSALGLMNSAVTRCPQLAAIAGFGNLAPTLVGRVDVLSSEGNSDWITLARALMLILCSEKCAIHQNLVYPTSLLIFKILEKSNDAETLVDALNSLFELFGDNDAPFNDQEYVQTDLNGRLEHLKPTFKRKLKSVPKDDRFLRDRALEALINLDNFIVYKRG